MYYVLYDILEQNNEAVEFMNIVASKVCRET